MKKAQYYLLFTSSLLIILVACNSNELPEKYGQTDTQLYLGPGKNQPLIVGLGGSEGGNMWTSDYWKKTREQLIDSGYALLALEYFGGKKTPGQLDRISIDSVYKAIMSASRNPQINPEKIVLIGGSKGAELALLLASKYPNIKGVVSIVGPHASFPALTVMATTSSWVHQSEEVPFVPLPWSATGAIIKNDLRKAFTIMLEDSTAVKKALIKVTEINGPILMISATQDEMWPSTEMSNSIMKQLEENNFKYEFKHIAIEGGHKAPLNHFDTIINFLNKNIK